jgi:hypothetical protein
VALLVVDFQRTQHFGLGNLEQVQQAAVAWRYSAPRAGCWGDLDWNWEDTDQFEAVTVHRLPRTGQGCYRTGPAETGSAERAERCCCCCRDYTVAGLALY